MHGKAAKARTSPLHVWPGGPPLLEALSGGPCPGPLYPVDRALGEGQFLSAEALLLGRQVPTASRPQRGTLGPGSAGLGAQEAPSPPRSAPPSPPSPVLSSGAEAPRSHPGCSSHPRRFSRLGRSTYLSPSTAVGFLFLATNAAFGEVFHELFNKDCCPEEALRRGGKRTRTSSPRAGGEHAQTGRLLCACAQSRRCLQGAGCPVACTRFLKALRLGPSGRANPLLKGSAVAQDPGAARSQPPRFGTRSAPCQLVRRGRWLHLSGRFLIYKQGALTVPAAQGLGESRGFTQAKNTESRLANGHVQ